MVKLLYGIDVIEGLKTLESESVNCVVTSPPFWGLRDYGTNGQIGLEKSPEEYVTKIVEAFREVKRALRREGTVWLNLGDSYVSAKSRHSSCPQTLANKTSRQEPVDGNRPDLKGHSFLKDKDLCGIPWRVAFALQADGWWLRQDIIWSKPNPMPESVTDRCTKAHEYIFLLTKSARYFFNAEAIKEPITESTVIRCRTDFITDNEISKRKHFDPITPSINPNTAEATRQKLIESGLRNKRSVWEIATQPYPKAHFATFPKEIPSICIQAGCPQGGLVLDPFAGSGTTGEVACGLGRDFIGIDLNKDYEKLARERIGIFCTN